MTGRVTTQRHDAVLRITLDRPDKHNAFTREMLDELGLAYGELHRDPRLRCGVLHGNGPSFTSGLDLPALAGDLASGERRPAPDGYIDPMGLATEACAKPVVLAVHGRCYTLGIELILAAEMAVAAAGTRFAQLEVARGVLPLAGANWRLPVRCGWGDAMRWILTGDEFDAAEAHRIGLVQQIAGDGSDDGHVEAAMGLALRIAAMAPLGVQGALANARTGRDGSEEAAIADVRRRQAEVFASADAREAVSAMLERRSPVFSGS